MMLKPLTIALDARWIFPEISGIGLYTQELIAGLARCKSPHTFILLFNHHEVMARTAAMTGFTHADNFQGKLVEQGPFAPQDQLALPALLKKLDVDVYHAPNYMMPLMLPARIKRVVTIHDLIPLLFREYAPRSKKNRLFPVFKKIMQTVACRADRIIAVSGSTRDDIRKHLLNGRDGEKISVIHEAANARHVPAATREPRDHVEFLFVGRRDPYKNLPLLIKAFSELKQRHPSVRLRIIGPDDARYPEARTLAAQLNLNGAITWSGYVSDDGLIDAYQQTSVFVMPSNYEGFGLPVLEAMACGAPVICSNKSSLPEVAGDAALLIDPGDVATLVAAMDRMICEPDTRAEYARRGLARAAQFTWDETARRTLAVYEEAAQT